MLSFASDSSRKISLLASQRWEIELFLLICTLRCLDGKYYILLHAKNVQGMTEFVTLPPLASTDLLAKD